MESEEVLLKGISHSEGLSPCSLFPHERNSLQPLPLSLSCRETGFKSGQSLRELLAESRFVDKVDMESTPCRCSLSGSTKSAFITVFSSDASYMASTHGDHNLYVTRLKDGICIRTLQGHPRTPWSAAFHPGIPGILASGCLGGHVRVWDYKASSGGSEFWNSNCVITSLTFHPVERLLFIATFNRIYLWDWRQSSPFTSLSTQSEKEKIIFVKFDPLGHHLITGISNLKSTPASNSNGAAASNSHGGGGDHNPFRVYSTASSDQPPPGSEADEASWYFRLMMPENESTRRRVMRPGLYSQMRRRLSASQTLSDLAAAASSQLEAENAASSAVGGSASSLSSGEVPHPPPPDRIVPRRSRYSRYPPDRRFNHSPESSFVEVGEGGGSSFMEVLYSNPDRSSRFHQRRARRLREWLTRRQSIYSRGSSSSTHTDEDHPEVHSHHPSLGPRRIDEWAVNRRMSLARLAGEVEPPAGPPGFPPDDPTSAGSLPEDAAGGSSHAGGGPLHLSIRSQVDLSVLGRHIEHMQRICQTSLRYLNVSRQRRQILRLQTIRMMLEDLQSQIRSLRESTLDHRSENPPPPPAPPLPPSSSTTSTPSPLSPSSTSSSSNAAHAMSITRRLHLTREGLNRAMRRLNRASASSNPSGGRPTTSSSTSTGSPRSRRSSRYSSMSRLILSRLRATVRAMEMSPDLSQSGFDNSVNELMAQESLAVMERTESSAAVSSAALGRRRPRRRRQEQQQQHDDEDEEEESEEVGGVVGSSNALRAMSERLERIIRENREMSSTSANNNDEFAAAVSSTNMASPRSIIDASRGRGGGRSHLGGSNPHRRRPFMEDEEEDTVQSLEEEEEDDNLHGSASNWSHLLDHGGYARQPLEGGGGGGASSDSSSEDANHAPTTSSSSSSIANNNNNNSTSSNNIPRVVGGGVEDVEDREIDEDEMYPLDLLLPSASPGRLWGGLRRDLGRASMRERLDSRAEFRRDYERARQRFSRARLIFNQRRERESNGEPSGAASGSNQGSSPQVDNWVLRYLLRRNMQLNALEEEIGGEEGGGGGEHSNPHHGSRGREGGGSGSSSGVVRPLHREILSWMVDQLSIDQQGGPQLLREDPLPEPIYRRRRTAFYFRQYEEQSAGTAARDTTNYFHQIRNHKYSPNHRLQLWDFTPSSGSLPDIGDRSKNIIVEKAKIYNDASVDISRDGRVLVTFASSSSSSSSSSRLNPMVGLYSLAKGHLGTLLASYSLESQAVSVSLSPTSRHLLIGVSSKSERLDSLGDRSLMAQVFKVSYPEEEEQHAGGGEDDELRRKRGRLRHHRDIHHSPEHGYIGLNSIRWIPDPGQGIVYATNTGLLQILR